MHLLNREELRKQFPLSIFEKSVVNYINTHKKEKLFVACSGGPDSISLLLLVWLHFNSYPCTILHYNHNIREASAVEEGKVRELAKFLNVDIVVKVRDNNKKNSEEILRKDRYDFFERVMHEKCGNCLLLGHQQDDVFETLFMRLIRGSSLNGIIAPKPIHIIGNSVRLRPLLSITKNVCEDICNKFGVDYSIDESNYQHYYLRNRVRNMLFPTFDKIFTDRNWKSGLMTSFTLLNEQNLAIDYYEDIFLKKFDLTNPIQLRKKIEKLPRSTQRKFFINWFKNFGILKFDKLDLFLDLFSSGRSTKVSITDLWQVIFNCDDVVIEKRITNKLSFKIPFGKCCTVCLPSGNLLIIKENGLCGMDRINVMNKKLLDSCVVYIDKNSVKLPLYVRNWEYGDRYVPFGFKTSKKVKNLFLDKKIKTDVKNSLPVICDSNDDIVWIPGLPLADKFKIVKNTKISFVLSYKNLKNSVLYI